MNDVTGLWIFNDQFSCFWMRFTDLFGFLFGASVKEAAVGGRGMNVTILGFGFSMISSVAFG
jgi:hypothetical protein